MIGWMSRLSICVMVLGVTSVGGRSESHRITCGYLEPVKRCSMLYRALKYFLDQDRKKHGRNSECIDELDEDVDAMQHEVDDILENRAIEANLGTGAAPGASQADNSTVSATAQSSLATRAGRAAPPATHSLGNIAQGANHSTNTLGTASNEAQVADASASHTQASRGDT